MSRKPARRPFAHTDAGDDPIHCRHCGGRVRSKLGAVCSDPRCQALALSASPADAGRQRKDAKR